MTREKDIFKEVYLYFDKKCYLTGEFISEPRAWCFAHLLAKGENKYPKLRLYRNNIILVKNEVLHRTVDLIMNEIKKDIGAIRIAEMIENGEEIYHLIKERYESDYKPKT